MTHPALAAPGPGSRASLLARVVDRGAITAAFVGIGMALTIGISFLLVIPVEPIYWALSVPAGLLIGYYADARSRRGRGEWPRILANAVFAGLATGLTLAALLLAVKAIFFFGDTGYPSYNRIDGQTGALLEPTCANGAGCVYARYLDDQPELLARAGVTDAASFQGYYWAQQRSTAGLLVLLSSGFGLAGGLIFGITRPRSP